MKCQSLLSEENNKISLVSRLLKFRCCFFYVSKFCQTKYKYYCIRTKHMQKCLAINLGNGNFGRVFLHFQ